MSAHRSITWTDAAKRASDVIMTHLVADPEGNVGRWVAIRLRDGGSDGTVYDTRADAIWHQLHETTCMYIKIPPDGMPPAHAERLLAIHRDVYDAGFRLSDPEDRREVVMPHTMEDFRKVVRPQYLPPALRRRLT